MGKKEEFRGIDVQNVTSYSKMQKETPKENDFGITTAITSKPIKS